MSEASETITDLYPLMDDFEKAGPKRNTPSSKMSESQKGMFTPLVQAIHNNDLQEVKRCLNQNPEHKSEVFFLALSATSPIKFACERGFFEIADLLVQEGVDLNETHELSHHSLLMHFVINRKTASLGWLLKHPEVRLNDLSWDNHTALQNASSYMTIINQLVLAGADVNLTHPSKEPVIFKVIQVASIHSNPHNQQLLSNVIKAGANLDLKTQQGQTVLEVAYELGNHDVTELIQSAWDAKVLRETIAPISGGDSVKRSGPLVL